MPQPSKPHPHPRRHAYPTSARTRMMREHGFVPVQEAARATHLSRGTMYRYVRLRYVLSANDRGALYVHWRGLQEYLGVTNATVLAGVGDSPLPLPPGVIVTDPYAPDTLPDDPVPVLVEIDRS